MDFNEAWRKQQFRNAYNPYPGVSNKSAKQLAHEAKQTADNRAYLAQGMNTAVQELDALLSNLQALAAGSWRRNGGQ